MGLKSLNGYDYAPKALKDAVHLYESRPVYIDHNKTRSYKDRIGYLQQVSYDDGLRANLRVNLKHELAEQVLFDAENNSPNVGLSHSVTGEMDETKKLVVAINSVESVDIVADPATTKSFFEAVMTKKAQKAEKKAQKKALKEQKEKELTDALATVTKELDELKKEVSEFKSKTLNKSSAPLARPFAKDEDETEAYKTFIKRIKR